MQLHKYEEADGTKKYNVYTCKCLEKNVGMSGEHKERRRKTYFVPG